MINTEQDDKQFRRGVVLGLTMAEILLLLIFLLMLLMVSQLDLGEKQLKSAQDTAKTQEKELADLKGQLNFVLGKNGKKYDGLKDYVHMEAELAATLLKLQEAEQKLVTSGDADQLMKHAVAMSPDAPPQEAIEKMIQAADIGKALMRSDNDADKILANAASCQTRLDSCTGQVTYLSNALNNKRGGNDKPPCWADKDTGKIQYIFAMAVTDDGIVVTDRKVPGREKEQASLPIKSIVFDKPRTIGQFTQEVKGIYDWSVKNECRFHVPIANRTNLDTKAVTWIPVYKAIKDRFYSPD
ncbi:MAG: hypothetical protein HYU58_09055 [Proteobacteria bacterium]|nr:hypothetical protein [Pseudomonadota bacterium]